MVQEKTPEISAILPVYNGEDHLEECITSVLNQTFKNFEFIIVDDASTDSTPQILKDFANSDDRVKVITHNNNQKQTAAANTAINNAKGKYLARMDADDVALPNRFEKQYSYLEDNLECGMVGSWTETIDESGNIVGQWQTATSNGILKWNLLFGTSFAHSSVMMRTHIVRDVGLYQSPEAEDYDLWSRISRVSEVANIPEVLQQKRVWSGQLALKVPQETRDCVIEIMQKNIKHRLADDHLTLDFIRNIRAVSDKNPILGNSKSISQVWDILLKLYRNLRSNVELTNIETKLVSKDLYRKLKTLSDWQSSINLLRGLSQKLYLLLRFPKNSIYTFFKK